VLPVVAPKRRVYSVRPHNGREAPEPVLTCVSAATVS
jgi:hypothetical protein